LEASKARLASLDYLRGLAAFGVMVFHYSMWSFGLFSSENSLGRVGIYGVSIFYILSGLTLYLAYFDRMGNPSKKGLADFGIKRFFRIFPLLWLLSLVTILLEKDTFSRETIILNFTGLFSVAKWADTICYGAWSIGNELVFYLFFPVFIFLSKKSKLLFAAFSLGIFLMYLWFACVRMDSTKTLGDFFLDYTNPLNQVFLFLSGYLIGFSLQKINPGKTISLALIAASVLAFIFIPIKGDSILLVTGFNRLFFTLICLIVCFCFYKTNFGLPGIVHKALQTLGEISYSVYLAHPIAWKLLSIVLTKYLPGFNPFAKIGIGFALSIAMAYVVYHGFERPFMRMGKAVSKKLLG
jgi:peptidoglycan/LPS O-acetylase OafA/YrhL